MSKTKYILIFRDGKHIRKETVKSDKQMSWTELKDFMNDVGYYKLYPNAKLEDVK